MAAVRAIKEAALPTSVRIKPGMSLTPNEMRRLKDCTGRTLTELLGGDAENLDEAPDRIQALVWVQLRRDGFDPSWAEAGDVLPDYAQQAPDPPGSAPLTAS
jgi:hypothetical protein